jgi:hypothetical protein
MDITGYKVCGNIAKHAASIDAINSTSVNIKHKFVPFSGRVVDGPNGVFALSLTGQDSMRLREGKYVYNAVLENVNGDKIDTVSGLVFAESAFGSFGDETTEITDKI